MPVASVDPAGRALQTLRTLAEGILADDLDAVFGPKVTVGFVGSADADVVLTGDARGDADRWRLDLGGRWGRDGQVSALDELLWDPLTVQFPASPDPACAGGPASAPEDDVLFVGPDGTQSCLDWFGAVVRIDSDGRVLAVRLAFSEP